MSFDFEFGVREDYLCEVDCNFKAQFKFFEHNFSPVKRALILIKAHSKENTIFLFQKQLHFLPNN